MTPGGSSPAAGESAKATSGRLARLAAIDLGATSGRVIVAEIGPDRLALAEVARFANEVVEVNGTLRWDVLALWRGILGGLRAAGPVDAIGIDSWAVDFGLVDADGDLLGNPAAYRGVRTQGAIEQINAAIDPARRYAITGIQHQVFNTLYQLRSMQGSAQFAAARRMLMIPDLIGYWLTGQMCGEVTNASSSGLVDAAGRQYSAEVAGAADIDLNLMPELVEAGTVIGPLLPSVAAAVGQPRAQVVAVGTHDTASAVVGMPAADGEGGLFISCGTWSLAGIELDAPVLTEASRAANFTNELGVDGTVRYLRNVMGLWLLSESMRQWEREGLALSLTGLLASAASVPGLQTVVDAEDEAFLAPGDMPARIAAAAGASGQIVPRTPAEYARCIIDSLALAHRRALRDAQELSGRRGWVVHLVGGGAQNRLLAQATADACGMPVLAGPIEAAAIGNALVQARAVGAIGGSLGELRGLIRATQPVQEYLPNASGADWDRAEQRIRHTTSKTTTRRSR